ncbi:MAG: HK97 gp10 family phage protein [Candidatus Thorarchaeota archaeon]
MNSIKVTGLKETNGFLRGLPINLRKEINSESEQFMKDVRKSAKLRAPRDTKELANSIIIKKDGNTWILRVTSPYGVYQEEGFKPHWIHSDMIKGSSKLKRRGFFFVKKSKPFIGPALEHNLNKLSQRMNKATTRAIKKSRRK